MEEQSRAVSGRGSPVVAILSLCFGLVGLDRFIINPLFPVVARDLGFGYDELGLIAASLALAWGVAAILTGRLADRLSVKSVLVASMVAFSLLAGLTGLASGLGSLLLLRALMGFAEGAFVPACIVALTRASRPTQIGLNVGLGHMAAALFGLGLGPLLAVNLLGVLPSWRWVFLVVVPPGLLMAYLVHRLPLATGTSVPAPTARRAAWPGMLADWSLIANALAMACWLAGITTLAALLPSYLTDGLGLGLDQMGLVLSGLGVGGVVGMVIVPGLGDRFGHRRVAVLAVIVNLAALSFFALAPANTGVLFLFLLLAGTAGAGLMATTVGPLTVKVTPPHLAATATGLVVGAGEIGGGALAPALAGFLASRFGIAVVPLFVLAVTGLGLAALGLGARTRSAGLPTAPAT